MSEAVDIFRQEAQEHLDTLEAALLELEEEPDQEQINLAFRAMHTIKGAAGMVGFDHLSHFTHHLESFFDRLRNGEFELSDAMISLILLCRDHIQLLLEQPEPDAALIEMSDQLGQQINEFTRAATGDLPASQPVETPEQVEASALGQEANDAFESVSLWHIYIKPHSEAFQDGFDLLPVMRELTGLGLSAQWINFPSMDLDQFDAQRCYLQLTVLLETTADLHALEDVFIFVGDDWQIELTPLPHTTWEAAYEILAHQGVMDASTFLEQLPSSDEPNHETPPSSPEAVDLVEPEPFVSSQEISSGTPQAKPLHCAAKEKSKSNKRVSDGQVVKVPSAKLDSLMNLIGELVIVQARLNEVARVESNEQLDTLAEELSMLGTELRDTAFDIRMLPIGSTFARFRRLIRDLAKELHKDVQLKTEGADTELDKMVLDHLGDPLVHLLRNSMDHGIEEPQVRAESNKDPKGTIFLSAAHQDGQIVITIADDGAGLDREKIRQKAIQRGLISEQQELEPRQIYALIFEPGFSTADQVSDVSGRGVGMDVVRTSIEGLRGRVEIDSTAQQGTTTTIYLPMTLAIIEGLMIRVGQEHFIIPLSVVEECIETRAHEKTTRDGARLIENRGELISCVRLREIFKINSAPLTIEQTVITYAGKERIGITVDEVIGQYQTVIKSLSRLYQHVPGLMGATILGNGDVAMILDINKLVDEVKSAALTPVMSK